MKKTIYRYVDGKKEILDPVAYERVMRFLEENKDKIVKVSTNSKGTKIKLGLNTELN